MARQILHQLHLPKPGVPENRYGLFTEALIDFHHQISPGSQCDRSDLSQGTVKRQHIISRCEQCDRRFMRPHTSLHPRFFIKTDVRRIAEYQISLL